MERSRRRQGFTDRLSRRRFLGVLGAGAGLSAAGLATGMALDRKEVLRPPGAVEEEAFLSLCARCGRCIQVCPTSGLRLSGLGNGLESLMTPVLDPSRGYCTMPVDGCQRCIEACPPGVLGSLPIQGLESRELSRVLKIGTAVLDTGICIPYARQQDCVACIEVCPVEGAITISAGPGLGQGERVRRPVFNADTCVGCGACEHACVTRSSLGRPAVMVLPEGAKRTTYRG